MQANKVLQKCDDHELVTNVPFRELIGSLMYLMLGTRPDLCYAIGSLSQFSENHNMEHWTSCKKILRYIQKTNEFCLVYQKSENPSIHVYSDASWGNTEERKSISGFATFYGNCLLSWSSRKQTSVALSSTEAELIAVTEAAKEGKWLSKLMNDLKATQQKAFEVFVDNHSTI